MWKITTPMHPASSNYPFCRYIDEENEDIQKNT